MTDPEGELAALLPRLQRSMRVHYLDNLRSTLIALVIFHHSALPFGGIGYWPYISPYHPPDSSLVLGVFVAVNQTYFMGMLFFLSGHFSAIAASKKSWVEFSVDKLRRLGIPTVVSTIFLQPLVLILVKWAGSAPILPALLEYFKTLRGVRGPVWFLATLLVFDLTYIAIRTCLPSLSFLRPTSIMAFRVTAVVCISLVIISAFLIRMSHPVGTVWPPLSLQLGYTPQYILAYIAGISLSPLQAYLLVSHPMRSLAIAYLVAIFSLLAIISLSGPVLGQFKGGANPVAFAYAVWNELCFYFIGTALYSVFHHSEHTTRQWGNTARYCYGAFLLHSLVVVALQILSDTSGSAVSGVVKAIMVGTLGVIASWAASWAFLRLPGVAQII